MDWNEILSWVVRNPELSALYVIACVWIINHVIDSGPNLRHRKMNRWGRMTLIILLHPLSLVLSPIVVALFMLDILGSIFHGIFIEPIINRKTRHVLVVPKSSRSAAHMSRGSSRIERPAQHLIAPHGVEIPT